MKTQNEIEILQYNTSIKTKLQEAFTPILSFIKDLSFGYTRYYPNDTRIIIESNTQWLSSYIEKGFYDESLNECFSTTLTQADNQYTYLLTGKPTTPVHSLLFDYNIWNGICFFVKSKNYVEAFYLETSRDNYEILKLYISHPDIFQHMISFIREKFFDLKIHEAPKSPFSLTLSNKKEDNFQHTDHFSFNNSIIDDLSKKINVKKVYLPNYDVYLPKRQAECYFLLTKGLSSKEIGRRLELSPRTVESYILLIKRKLGVNYKNDIISNFHNYSLNELPI